jgi:hypothetical protein
LIISKPLSNRSLKLDAPCLLTDDEISKLTPGKERSVWVGLRCIASSRKRNLDPCHWRNFLFISLTYNKCICLLDGTCLLYCVPHAHAHRHTVCWTNDHDASHTVFRVRARGGRGWGSSQRSASSTRKRTIMTIPSAHSVPSCGRRVRRPRVASRRDHVTAKDTTFGRTRRVSIDGAWTGAPGLSESRVTDCYGLGHAFDGNLKWPHFGSTLGPLYTRTYVYAAQAALRASLAWCQWLRGSDASRRTMDLSGRTAWTRYVCDWDSTGIGDERDF